MQGPVVGVPVASTRPIGTLQRTRLNYDVKTSGAITLIYLELVVAMALQQNDVLSLTLPGFFTDSSEVAFFPQDRCEGSVKCDFLGRWSTSSETMTLEVRRRANMPAGSRVNPQAPKP